jgi:hypothetical protein
MCSRAKLGLNLSSSGCMYVLIGSVVVLPAGLYGLISAAPAECCNCAGLLFTGLARHQPLVCLLVQSLCAVLTI